MFRLLFLFSLLILFSCQGRIDDNLPNNPNIGNTNLTIRVIDKSQVKPVPNASVSLRKDEQQIVSEQLTDEEGKVVFKNIQPGDNYRAFVTRALGYKTAASSLINVVQGSSSNIANILLDRITQGEGSGLIVGSVKNRTTKLPISRALITYVGPSGSGLGKQYFTDENGSFIIEGLIPGQYVVNISYGNAKEQKRVVVNEGQVTNIETIFLQVNNQTGNFLVSLNGDKKIVQLDKTGRINWSYNQLSGVENAIKLPSGNIFAVDNNTSKIIQINNETKNSNNIILDLKQPSWIDAINDDTILVTDTSGNKVIEYSKGKIIWSYNNLSRPRSATYIPNGNILITDMGNRRVIEVDKKNKIVWEYSENMDKPSYSSRLANGNTLITDTGYSRIIEVSPDKKVFWWYSGIIPQNGNTNNNYKNGLDFDYPTNKRNIKVYAQEEPYGNPGNDLLFPRQAIPLNNGNILISDTGNNRIVEVSKDKKIVWQLDKLFRPISVGLL